MGSTLTANDTISGGGNSSSTGDTLTATVNSLGDAVTASKLNIDGVENILTFDLNDDEKNALHNTLTEVKKTVQETGL